MSGRSYSSYGARYTNCAQDDCSLDDSRYSPVDDGHYSPADTAVIAR